MQANFTEGKLSKRLDTKKVHRMEYYVESSYFYIQMDIYIIPQSHNFIIFSLLLSRSHESGEY